MPDTLRRRLALLIAAAARLLPGSATADLRTFGLSQPVQLGAVTFRWFGLPVYRAQLHTDGGTQFDWSRPLALQIEYFRSISEADLISSTRSEILRMEGPRSDQDAMMQKLAGCFRTVGKGDVFTAVSTRAETMALHLNGVQTCTISHPGLRKRFLSIWLSDNSRSARLSASLRGE